jgi:hypothetical protein
MRTTVLTLLAIVASLPVIPIARAGDSVATAARAGVDAIVTGLAGDGTTGPSRNAIVQVTRRVRGSSRPLRRASRARIPGSQ